jgi:enoyl-CoA hydratase/carnithine racemase
MNQAVMLETQESVAWITVNRPEALNAINDDVRRLLPEAIRAAEADASVGVIVVQGAGPRAFCVGADIKEFAAVPAPAVYRQSRAYDHWIRAFDEAKKPIIASVHGHCLGGGLEIALACDLRIAARNARFGFPETGHGIIPGAGGSQRIARVLGMGLALDLILTGEHIDADHALRIGLVSRITEPDTLTEQTRALAAKIAAKPPMATMFAKEAVRRGRELELFAGLRLEADLQTHLLNTEDRLEAANAFREKRAPRFVGK